MSAGKGDGEGKNKKDNADLKKKNRYTINNRYTILSDFENATLG